MVTVSNGSNVKVHYVGTYAESGEEFDNSHTRGAPIEFTVGNGSMITGFENAVIGMSTGDVKEITVEPNEAYGSYRDELVNNFPKTNFPDDFDFSVGSFVQANNTEGQTLYGKIKSVESDQVEVDFNHPLAGETINFKIELVSIT